MLLPRLAQDVLRQPVHRDPHRAALAAQAVTGLQWHGQQIASAQAQRGAGGQGGFTGVAVASPSLGLDACLERNPLASMTLLEHDEAGHAWLNWTDYAYWLIERQGGDPASRRPWVADLPGSASAAPTAHCPPAAP